MLEAQGKVMGLKETASALLADGWQENVAWNGQENACLRDADASWMDVASESSETAEKNEDNNKVSNHKDNNNKVQNNNKQQQKQTTTKTAFANAA